MLIQGLQKLTLLDFPGRVACTVFLGGCDFRCPFCHNSELIGGGEDKFAGIFLIPGGIGSAGVDRGHSVIHEHSTLVVTGVTGFILRIGVDVIVLVHIRHDRIADEIRKGIAAFLREVLLLHVGIFSLHVDMTQIGNQLIASVGIEVPPLVKKI